MIVLVEWRKWPGGEGGTLLGGMDGWMDGKVWKKGVKEGRETYQGYWL